MPSCLSRVRLFATPRTEEPAFPALAGRFLTTELLPDLNLKEQFAFLSEHDFLLPHPVLSFPETT